MNEQNKKHENESKRKWKIENDSKIFIHLIFSLFYEKKKGPKHDSIIWRKRLGNLR